jgi:hypothetical protein
MAQPGEPFEFAYDYNQLYLYDAVRQRPFEGNEYLDALDAARAVSQSVRVRGLLTFSCRGRRTSQRRLKCATHH